MAELGAEDPEVPIGPLHRPGQPCIVCHDGVSARDFSIAGTVYWTEGSEIPAAGTEVQILDADQRSFTALTNCAGSFWIRPEEFAPRFPFWVRIRKGSTTTVMDSPVRADGSCAGCHGREPGPDSAGRVYLHALEPAEGPGECP